MQEQVFLAFIPFQGIDIQLNPVGSQPDKIILTPGLFCKMKKY